MYMMSTGNEAAGQDPTHQGGENHAVVGAQNTEDNAPRVESEAHGGGAQDEHRHRGRDDLDLQVGFLACT
jgi:hypothetical protein